MRTSITRRLFAAIVSILCTASIGWAQTNTDLLERGRYIATAIQGCACHTREGPDGTKDDAWHLAGAPAQPPATGPSATAGWTNPRWKKLYARNITPDPETGIGKWTEADFIRALRAGLTPDGRILDPFMPWGAFQQLTDPDLKALWAYLRTIQPIRNKVPDSIRAERK